MTSGDQRSPDQRGERPYRAVVRTMLRDRLLDAAAGAFADDGWRRLTMARVADRAGVSRQTVYNEFGTKQQLAEQMVLRELDSFLDIVRQTFEAEPDFPSAVRSAVHGALQVAEKNALLRAVLEGGHSGNAELLPFIFQSQDIIDTATESLHSLVQVRFPDLPVHGDHLLVAMESVVRLVLSHISQPTGTPEKTADELGWVMHMVIEGARASASVVGTESGEPAPGSA